MPGKKTAAPAGPTITVKKSVRAKLLTEAEADVTPVDETPVDAQSDTSPKAGKVRRVGAEKAATEKAVKTTVKKVVVAEAEADVDEPAGPKKKAAKAKGAETPKRATKAKAKSKDAELDEADLSDIDDELEGEPELAEPSEAAASSPTEKVKPLRMKISKAKEKALMKEFGLDDTVLSEEEVAQRRQRLKTLIKLGKTRGYLTHGEINDHLPDKLVEAETLEVVISLLNDMGVAVYEQTPDAETLLLNNTGPTAATEEEAEEEAEAALSTVDSEFGRTTDPVRMY
ncbi:MAG: RNA polymerase sigma factor region1.1 domain-containing protein, partial [Burkholderiaceae bacterium]